MGSSPIRRSLITGSNPVWIKHSAFYKIMTKPVRIVNQIGYWNFTIQLPRIIDELREAFLERREPVLKKGDAVMLGVLINSLVDEVDRDSDRDRCPSCGSHMWERPYVGDSRDFSKKVCSVCKWVREEYS